MNEEGAFAPWARSVFRERVRSGSGPIGEDLLGLGDLLRRAGETVLVFPALAGDLDLDGVEAAVLHPQPELLGDFLDGVLLEAFAHG